MTIELNHYLILSTLLFLIGAGGFLLRRNALVALMSIELMLNAVNLMLVAFNRWQPLTEMSVRMPQDTASQTAGAALQTVSAMPQHGQVFAFFVIAVAAAEAAVGLAIVLSLYRVRKSVRTDDANLLKE